MNVTMNINNISQDVAKQMFFEGGTFMILNVPKGTEFGIDMKVWNTDENFKGIKMIPPGLHFIHYSAVSNTGDQTPRSGFYHNFTKSELLVKQYDRQTEDISTTPVEDTEINRLKQNLVNYDKYLGPYPYDTRDKWIALTTYLNDKLVNELMPLSGYVRSALILMSCNDADRPRGGQNEINKKRKRRSSHKEHGEELLPDLKPVEGTELRFTKFPEQNYPEGATSAEITKHSLDSTYVLEFMLKRHKSDTEFIGEIQFAFVCFLIGHSLEAFEHWKALVGLVCSCDVAIIKHRGLYDMFISILEVQLKEIPEEFLADIVANNNFVYVKLRTLFRTVQESNVDGRLKTKMSRFKENLKETYHWDFSNLSEDEEDEAPVIVEM